VAPETLNSDFGGTEVSTHEPALKHHAKSAVVKDEYCKTLKTHWNDAGSE
jgi:hypothetical protein